MASFLTYIYFTTIKKNKVTLHEGGLKSNQRCQRDTWRDRQVKAENETGVTRPPAKGHDIPAVPRSQERGTGFILLRPPQGNNYANVFFKKMFYFISTMLG